MSGTPIDEERSTETVTVYITRKGDRIALPKRRHVVLGDGNLVPLTRAQWRRYSEDAA